MQFTLEKRLGIRVAVGTLGVAILAVTPFIKATPADAQKSAAQPIAVSIMADVVTAAPDTVRAGQVTFQATNRTQRVQDLQINGPGVDTELDNIAAGATRSVSMAVRPGTYRLRATEENGDGKERISLVTVLP